MLLVKIFQLSPQDGVEQGYEMVEMTMKQVLNHGEEMEGKGICIGVLLLLAKVQ